MNKPISLIKKIPCDKSQINNQKEEIKNKSVEIVAPTFGKKSFSNYLDKNRMRAPRESSSLFLSPRENLPESVKNLLKNTNHSPKIPDFNNLFDIEEADNSVLFNPQIGKKIIANSEDSDNLKENNSSEQRNPSQNVLDFIKEEKEIDKCK